MAYIHHCNRATTIIWPLDIQNNLTNTPLSSLEQSLMERVYIQVLAVLDSSLTMSMSLWLAGYYRGTVSQPVWYFYSLSSS